MNINLRRWFFYWKDEKPINILCDILQNDDREEQLLCDTITKDVSSHDDIKIEQTELVNKNIIFQKEKESVQAENDKLPTNKNTPLSIKKQIVPETLVTTKKINIDKTVIIEEKPVIAKSSTAQTRVRQLNNITVSKTPNTHAKNKPTQTPSNNKPVIVKKKPTRPPQTPSNNKPVIVKKKPALVHEKPLNVKPVIVKKKPALVQEEPLNTKPIVKDTLSNDLTNKKSIIPIVDDKLPSSNSDIKNNDNISVLQQSNCFQPINTNLSASDMRRTFKNFKLYFSQLKSEEQDTVPHLYIDMNPSSTHFSNNKYAPGLKTNGTREINLIECVENVIESLSERTSMTDSDSEEDVVGPDSPSNHKNTHSIFLNPTQKFMNDFEEQEEEDEQELYENFCQRDLAYIKEYEKILENLRYRYEDTGEMKTYVDKFCDSVGRTLNLLKITTEYIQTSSNEGKSIVDTTSTPSNRQIILDHFNKLLQFLEELKKFNENMMELATAVYEIIKSVDESLSELSKYGLNNKEIIKKNLEEIDEAAKSITTITNHNFKKFCKESKENYGDIFKTFYQRFKPPKQQIDNLKNNSSCTKTELLNKFLK